MRDKKNPFYGSTYADLQRRRFDLVAADVQIGIGEQPGHLLEQLGRERVADIDEAHDLLRAEAGSFGLDRDLRRREFGKDTVFCFAEREQAVLSSLSGKPKD